MTVLPLVNPVDAPPATPPKSGLIPAAKDWDRLHEIKDSDFGLGGVTYRPETVADARARSNLNNNAGSNVNRAEASDDKKGGLVTAYPVVLSVEESCSAFGWKQNDYEGRAKRALEALGSKILEWEFWTGEVAQMDALDPDIYQWLAQVRVAESGSAATGDLVRAHGAVDLTPAGGAVDPKHALAIIEQALGEAGNGTGTIHTTRSMGLLTPDRWIEGPIVNWPDSMMVVGAGYPGTGPDGTPAPAGEDWVYATNLVDVWLGDVHLFPETIEEAFDRAKNTISYRAERLGATSWDGNAHYAIRVTV